jgi:Fe-S cluster biogenesis protein NfuA
MGDNEPRPLLPALPSYDVGPGIFSKRASSSSSVVRRLLKTYMNKVTNSAATTSPSTVKTPATAPLLAKKPFGDADVEAFAADMADVDVCGICANVVGKINGEVMPNVVTAAGVDNVVGVDEVDGWIVVVDDRGACECVDVDVVNTMDGVVLDATGEGVEVEGVGAVWGEGVGDG